MSQRPIEQVKPLKILGLSFLILSAILLLVAHDVSYQRSQGAEQRVSDYVTALQAGDLAAFNEQSAREARQRGIVADERMAGSVLAILGVALFACGKSRGMSNAKASNAADARLLQNRMTEAQLDV